MTSERGRENAWARRQKAQRQKGKPKPDLHQLSVTATAVARTMKQVEEKLKAALVQTVKQVNAIVERNRDAYAASSTLAPDSPSRIHVVPPLNLQPHYCDICDQLAPIPVELECPENHEHILCRSCAGERVYLTGCPDDV